jgi:transcriptional regulator with XRE-family HTH domain
MIGRQIKYFRTIKKMTQEELAGKVYVNRQAVSKWENGSSYPEVDILIRLSKLFEVSLDKLILNKDDRSELNITNGDCFNAFVKERFDENFLPFREAMIEGKTSIKPFSDDFNRIRAEEHRVTNEDYLRHMAEFYAILPKLDEIGELTLWFGQDAFCQINLLTILAYLEQAGYRGKTYTLIIEDASKAVVRAKQLLLPDAYYQKYVELMVKGNRVSFADAFLTQGAAAYLSLRDENGSLIKQIKAKRNALDKKEMFELVWKLTRKDGLGDSQVYHLIEKYTDFRYGH